MHFTRITKQEPDEEKTPLYSRNVHTRIFCLIYKASFVNLNHQEQV